MTLNKRSKNTRQRGSTAHGSGSMKKKRGAGSRGGRGMAGTGKRGDVAKPSIWKNKKYFGKHGFNSNSRAPEFKTINIKTLEDRSEKLVSLGIMKLQNGAYYIDLDKIGCNKLLSTGKVTKKYMITALAATEKSIAKIKEAGGSLSLTGEVSQKDGESKAASKKETAE